MEDASRAMPAGMVTAGTEEVGQDSLCERLPVTAGKQATIAEEPTARALPPGFLFCVQRAGEVVTLRGLGCALNL